MDELGLRKSWHAKMPLPMSTVTSLQKFNLR